MSGRLGIVEEPELPFGRQKIGPVFRTAFYREDGTGGHIVESDLGEEVDKGRDTGVVREDGNGFIGIIEIADHFFEVWR